MAGEVIDSLLVRLGLETDAKDFREAQSMFDGVRRSALQFGAVIGAGLGVRELTFGFASAKDELAKFGEVYGVTAQFVDSLGYALEQSGGSARDAFGSIKRIRDLLEATEWGEVASDAFRVAGFDPYLLRGVTDASEAYERLAEAVQGLSQEDARRALSALGFGDAEIRLFRQGPEGLRQLLAESESYARVTKEMTDRAARFQTELTRMTKAVEGVSNELSALVLDDFSDAMRQAADYLRENRSEIAGFFEKALPWLEATAVGIGALVALQAGQKGLALLGPLARFGGPVAAVATAFQFSRENPNYLQHSKDAFLADEGTRSFFRAIGNMTGWEWAKDWGGANEGPGYDPNNPSLPSYEDIIGGLGGPVTPPPVPLPPPPAPSIHTENHITVDARGASDPAAVEAAGQRGVEKALQRAAESAVNDLRTPVR